MTTTSCGNAQYLHADAQDQLCICLCNIAALSDNCKTHILCTLCSTIHLAVAIQPIPPGHAPFAQKYIFTSLHPAAAQQLRSVLAVVFDGTAVASAATRCSSTGCYSGTQVVGCSFAIAVAAVMCQQLQDPVAQLAESPSLILSS